MERYKDYFVGILFKIRLDTKTDTFIVYWNGPEDRKTIPSRESYELETEISRLESEGYKHI